MPPHPRNPLGNLRLMRETFSRHHIERLLHIHRQVERIFAVAGPFDHLLEHSPAVVSSRGAGFNELCSHRIAVTATPGLQLLALVDTERSGREVAMRYTVETGKAISYGTLYTTFRRLKDAGWVSVRDDADEDGRVRYFRITGAGALALRNARKHHENLATFGLQGARA